MGKIILVCVTLLTIGCAPNKAALSAGHVGCRAKDIKVSEEDTSFGIATWVAACHGKSYICTLVSGGKNGGPNTNCKPLDRDSKK